MIKIVNIVEIFILSKKNMKIAENMVQIFKIFRKVDKNVVKTVKTPLK